jgi:hypothetical protein
MRRIFQPVKEAGDAGEALLSCPLAGPRELMRRTLLPVKVDQKVEEAGEVLYPAVGQPSVCCLVIHGNSHG